MKKFTKDPKTNKNITKNITFKDSYRIFPIKLDDLCQIFKVSNKIINII